MAKAKAEARKPEGFDLYPLVVCWDGPRAGHWYFEDHGAAAWNKQMAQAMVDPGPGSTIVGYVDSGLTVKHPRWPEVRGKALRWEGGSSGSDA